MGIVTLINHTFSSISYKIPGALFNHDISWRSKIIPLKSRS